MPPPLLLLLLELQWACIKTCPKHYLLPYRQVDP
jgi:hypothetical protein